MGISVYGPQDGWTNNRTLTALAIALAIILGFIYQESRTSEPILPLNLFKNHTFTITSILGFIIGAGMFGAIVMLPLYLQVVKGDSATSAGLKLIPFMMGIVSMSITSGKLITKHGHYKRYPIIGLTLMTIGISLLTLLDQTTPFWEISIYAILIGAGLGFSMQTIVIALQNSVDFRDMGVATSANTFFRSIGATIGVALFGTVYSSRLTHFLPIEVEKLQASNPAALIGATPEKFAALKENTAVLETFSPELQAGIINAFVNSFHAVFISAAPITALGVLVALFLRETPLKTGAQHSAAKEEAAGEAVA